MNVKLISVTKPYIEGLSPEELLVYIARVSNPANQMNTETSDKLIAYMIRNKHWSPFDMINLTVEVTTSRAIAHQILRHWSIKPQEFSQRYAEAVDFEPVELRRAGATNRQSSAEVFDPVLDGFANGVPASIYVDAYIKEGEKLYKSLLEHGTAKECARMILPLTTSTTMYLNGSVRSWIHYIEQRTDLHAQLEHRHVANEILSIFKDQFPMTFKAIDDNRLASRSSIELVKEFHEVFNHLIAPVPNVPNQDIIDFRTNFITEELNELKDAALSGDLVELADALGDIQYVLDGFFLNSGLLAYKDAIMAEIHRSNMSKVCASEQHANDTILALSSNPVNSDQNFVYQNIGSYWVVYRENDMKVQKSTGYSKPDLKSILDGSKK